MSLADVLNADVEVIGQRLREGVAWWVDELRGMAEPLAAPARGRAAVWTAERRADGAYVLYADGQADRLHTAGAGAPAVELQLPAALVLTRGVALPPLPDRDLRRLVALDLDRLTPFPPEAIYHDMVAPPPGEDGRRAVRLAAVLRAEADREVAEARRAGLDPTAVIAVDPVGTVFDFLPAMQAAGALGGLKRRVDGLWIVVALLVALNVGVAIWRDVAEVGRLQAAVAAQQPVVERVRAWRREVLDGQADARARAKARDAGDPLRVLDALSRALPDGAWVQRLSWNGAAVRIVGQRREGVDVVAALRREPLFAEVRDTDPGSAGSGAFDVVAEVRGAAPPAEAMP